MDENNVEIITAEQAAEAAKGLNFEIVWAALMENRQQMHELFEEMRKSNEELKSVVHELSRSIGGINNTLGEFTEAMFSPNLLSESAQYGIHVTEQSERKTISAGGKKLANDVRR